MREVDLAEWEKGEIQKTQVALGGSCSCRHGSALEHPNFSESHKSLQTLGFRLQDLGSRVGGEPTFLKGSWDLVTRVINTVSILIITYSPT